MKVIIIAAVAENGVIGSGISLPWKVSEDMRYFKAHTVNHTVVMGRKTFESFGRRALSCRSNVVVSSTLGTCPGVVVAPDITAALVQARQIGAAKLFIIGGAQLYRVALRDGLVDSLMITRLHRSFAGDIYFPEVSWEEWQLTSSSEFFDRVSGIHGEFEIYERSISRDTA